MTRDTRWTNLFRVATLATALAATAGLAAAQQSSPKDDGALKGPKVKDEGAPGKNRKLVEKGGARAEDREIPMRIYARAIETLKPGKEGKSIPDGAALTADQDKAIQAIIKDYGSQVEAFRKEHGEEVRELARILPPEDRRKVMAKLAMMAPPRDAAGRPAEGQRPQRPANGERPQRPAQDDPMADGPKASQEEIAVATKRLKEIAEAAPKTADAQAKVWAVLSDTQKPVVKAELARIQGEVEKRRAEGEGMGEGDRPAMSPEMREKLKNMSPEERQKAIEEFRKNRQNEAKKPGQSEGKEKGKGKKPADKSTPPDMDDVEIPDPE